MWVEETKNGKYKFVERYTDYLTGRTKRVSVTMDKNTAQTRKIAQRTLDEKIGQAAEPQEPETLTLETLVEAYRTSQKETIKPSTYKRNYYAGEFFLETLGRDVLVERLTAKYVKDNFLSSGIENDTFNEKLIRFKAMMRWAYKNDYVTNISFLDKLELVKSDTRRQKIQEKYLESKELKQLVEGMNMENWRLLTQFLALSGLRIGEAIALNISDVSVKDRQIIVNKTYDTNNDITTSPKTACSIREVYMQPELAAVCKQIKHFMFRQSMLCGYQSELFFQDETGNHIHYDNYRIYLMRKAKKIVGREITPHALRHTHASLLLENGVHIETIARRLGHENSKITREIYLHVTEKLKEKDNEQISNVKMM